MKVEIDSAALADAVAWTTRVIDARREVNLFFLDDMPDVFASPDKNHVLTDIEGAILSMEFYLDVCVSEQANPKDEH